MNTIIIFCASYLYLVSIALYALVLLQSPKKKRLSIIWLSALSFPLTFIIGKLSGYLISSPRPFVTEHIKPLIAHVADNGFPSDHTLLTMTIATVIFIYHKKVGIVLFILALLVGTARVVGQIHHPLDIIGASAIAIATTLASFFIKKKMTKNKS
jgi:undecaprenyl-diphosphatase